MSEDEEYRWIMSFLGHCIGFLLAWFIAILILT